MTEEERLEVLADALATVIRDSALLQRNLFEAASELDAEPVLSFSMDVSVGEVLADRVEAFTGRSFQVDLHQDPWVEAATHIAQSVLEETRHRDA